MKKQYLGKETGDTKQSQIEFIELKNTLKTHCMNSTADWR